MFPFFQSSAAVKPQNIYTKRFKICYAGKGVCSCKSPQIFLKSHCGNYRKGCIFLYGKNSCFYFVKVGHSFNKGCIKTIFFGKNGSLSVIFIGFVKSKFPHRLQKFSRLRNIPCNIVGIFISVFFCFFNSLLNKPGRNTNIFFQSVFFSRKFKGQSSKSICSNNI